MSAAKEHAEEAHRRALCAELREGYALEAESVDGFFADAQASQRNWMQALISLLRFLDALPEPVAIPPVPQPSEEARRRGLLVGAVVRDALVGDVGRVVSHGSGGLPLVQWRDAATRCQWRDAATRCGTDHLTVIRPAPPVREPNEESVKRGLYIGALVNIDDTGADADTLGEIVGWDSAGDPIVEHERWCAAYIASDVTLAGDAS